MTNVENMAARIIARSSGERPADGVLREELKAAKLPRRESRSVAELVFCFFRWRGWLSDPTPGDKTFAAVRELDLRFRSDRSSFSTEELMHAVPAWIADELTVTREWLLALQSPPPLWVRVKRGTGREVVRELGNCVRQDGWLEDALEYFGDKDLYRTPEFQTGDFEVQDVASQMVGLLCAPQPGETWWDACAGEGGKLLHLSDLMGNKGLIWASDRSERRLIRLKQRAARAKAFNYRAVPWDGSAKLPTRTKIRRGADRCAVQRGGHVAAESARALDDDAGGCAGAGGDSAPAGAERSGGGEAGRPAHLRGLYPDSFETDAVADFCSPQLSGFGPSLRPAGPVSRQQHRAGLGFGPRPVGERNVCSGVGAVFMSWGSVEFCRGDQLERK